MKRIKNLKWILALAAVSVSVSSCDKECKNAPDLGTKENHNITTLRFSDTLTMTLPNTRVMELDQIQKQSTSGVTYQMPQIKWNVGDKYSMFGCIRYKDETNPDNWKQNYGILVAEVISVSDDNRTGKFRLHGNINMKTRNINLADPNNPKLVDNEDNWYFMGLLRGKTNSDTGFGLTDNYEITAINDIKDDYREHPEDFISTDQKGLTFISPDTLVAVHPKDDKFKMNVPLGISPTKVKIVKAGNNSYELKAKDSSSPFSIRPIGNVLCLKLKNPNKIPISISYGDKLVSNIKIRSRYLLNSKIYFDFWHYTKGLTFMGTDKWIWHYEVGEREGSSRDESYSYLESGAGGTGIRKEQTLSIDWKPLLKSQYLQSDGMIVNTTILKDKIILKPQKEINLYVWSVYNTFYMNDSEKSLPKPIEIDLAGLQSSVGRRKIITPQILNDRLPGGAALTIPLPLEDK